MMLILAGIELQKCTEQTLSETTTVVSSGLDYHQKQQKDRQSSPGEMVGFELKLLIFQILRFQQLCTL